MLKNHPVKDEDYRMKILYVCDNLGGGGAQKLLSDLASVGKEDDCEFLLLSDRPDKYSYDLINKGIKISVIPSSINSLIGKVLYISRFISIRHYDVIHVNLYPALYYVAFAKRLRHFTFPSLVATEHSTDNKRRHKRFLRPIERYVYNSYDRVIAISNQTKINLDRWLGNTGDSSWCTVIENGIKIDEYRDALPYRKEELIESYKTGDVLIGIVGSFTPQKNHQVMIEAIKLLPQRYKLVCVGEGPLLNQIKQETDNINMQDRVFYLGFRKDVPQIMHTLDMICIPSLWEGFGLIAVEAMAAGLPIFCSDVPGLADVVEDCAVKFEANNPEGVASSILNTNRDLIERNIAIGKKLVNKYDIRVTQKRYYTLFRSIIN